MTTTQFWLIRHGETDWNAQQRLQGWRDIPLSAAGIDQSERLGQHLRSDLFDAEIDVIVSSDLTRASETARLAASHLGLPIIAYPPLRERCFGIYEGHDWARLKESQPGEPYIDFRDPHQIIEEGETLHTFETRIIKAFENLAQDHKGHKVMVFSHGGVIDVVWRKIMNIAPQALRLHAILNTSVNQFAIDDDVNWRVINWGQAGHLQTPALDDVS